MEISVIFSHNSGLAVFGQETSVGMEFARKIVEQVQVLGGKTDEDLNSDRWFRLQ
jgi:hypothetical protein